MKVGVRVMRRSEHDKKKESEREQDVLCTCVKLVVK